MMSTIVNKKNLTAAGIVTIAAVLVITFTASRPKWQQGAAALVATAVTLPFAMKVAG